jgi:hypothetical protein
LYVKRLGCSVFYSEAQERICRTAGLLESDGIG